MAEFSSAIITLTASYTSPEVRWEVKWPEGVRKKNPEKAGDSSIYRLGLPLDSGVSVWISVQTGGLE